MRYECVLSAWRDHEQELRGFLTRRLPDPDSAEDLLQEVFLRAMGQGPVFCSLETPRAWLFRVARNAVIDRHRRWRPVDPLPEQTPAPDTDTADPVDSLAECLQRALEQLSASDRDVLRRCDLSRETQAGYARAQGLNLPAVKARLQRARRRLREVLERSCEVRYDELGRVCCHRASADTPAAR